MMSEQDSTPKITRRNILEYWWLAPVAAAAGFFGWFGIRSYNILLGKSAPGPAKFNSGSRIRVGSVSEFAKVWTSKQFDYPVKLGSSIGKTPVLVIRTTQAQAGGISVGDQHFLGLSRICTHLNCVCDLVRDPEVAALAYKFRPDQGQPLLGCACHYSAFDPEQAGASVGGPALKNLPRVQLEHRNGELFATGIETA
jgi:arsenite oxidase small subunit